MTPPKIRLPMYEKLRKTGVVFLISGGIGVLYYVYLHYSETGNFPEPAQRTIGFISSFFTGTIVGLALYYANHFLDRLVSWRSNFASRMFVGYITQVVISLFLVASASMLIVMTFGGNALWNRFTANDTNILWKLGILILVSSFIYSIVYSLLFSYKQYATTQIESLQGERKQMELQFEALKSQLSPHYLFNSLNTISSLIYKDPLSAEQFVRRLAQTYHYILSTQKRRYVALREEIDFVQSYYYLLKIRFQQALTVEINLPANIMSSQIPPLTLQILVENAVKHNRITPEKPMFIYISALDNTQLRISNTKNEPVADAPSFRIGLENIRRRYEFFTDRKIEISDAEKFMVALPIIQGNLQEVTHKIPA